jgi:methionyl-tRNA formyltransferase
MKRRLIFMGSDPIALPGLEFLTGDAAGEVDLVGVFTQPDRAVRRGKKVQANEIKQWAMSRGIAVTQPEKIGPAELDWLQEKGGELVLVMAYGHILRRALIDFPALGTYNLHASLLPKYRGAAPIQAAVASGDAVTGVTLMRMVRRLDAGPMVDQEVFEVERLETGQTAEVKMAAACVPLLRRNLGRLLDGKVSLTEQEEAESTYTRKLDKTDGGLDFSASAEVLARRINALYPWPGSFVDYQDQRVKIGRADWSMAAHGRMEPGTVISGDGDGLRVATGSGELSLLSLQRPGGRLLPVVEFLRGFPIPFGTRFPSRAMLPLVGDEPFPYVRL